MGIEYLDKNRMRHVRRRERSGRAGRTSERALQGSERVPLVQNDGTEALQKSQKVKLRARLAGLGREVFLRECRIKGSFSFLGSYWNSSVEVMSKCSCHPCGRKR
jgi:hypothetical protein